MHSTHTPLLIKLVGNAEDIAKSYEHSLSPDHFLLGIIDLGTGVGYNVLYLLLKREESALKELRGELERRIRGEEGGIILNGRSNEMVNRMYAGTRAVSTSFGNPYQGTQHILCALADLDGINSHALLSERAILPEQLRRGTLEFRGLPVPQELYPGQQRALEEELDEGVLVNRISGV